MTVQTELRRVVQTGNGATSTFYFNAPVLGLDDLDVYTVTTAGVQTLQTRGGAGTFDYTMTINASTKYATVTLNNNLTNGYKVVMLRSTAITQGVDYVEGDPFLAETHEGALDRLTIIATQLQEQLDRSVKVVETSTTTGIKIEELEADKILVVNSAADGLTMGPTLAEVDTVADNIADVQTVATNIASVNTVASDLNEAVSEINTVAVNITNVNNVGTYISNVNTVATDIANINTVASDLNEAVSEIHTVGTNIANVNTVGTDIANVNTVAGAIANVNTAATNIASINTNATNIASINTNATNIVAIQNASTNATNAATSASNAATSETNSAASAILANDWATKTSGPVAGGEYSAKYHAQAAATSASGASTSASNASTSATNASNSATASANSATSAAASAASAAALLDNFDDRYLGAKASDPALDNDGNALVLGALYFNTTDGVMKVYTASGWIAASSASVATLATFEFVATAGQTVFSGNDANGASLSYVAPALIVTLNGVRLRPGDDYTATNGTSITLVSAAALNDELVVDAFGSFLVANTYTIAQADTNFQPKSNALTAYASSGVGMRNRIINGAMVIDQRNAGASVTVANAYTLDRWAAYANGSGVFSIQQSTTAPVGFTNSCLLTVTTADASVSGADYYLLRHVIEGYNFADLNFGSANAKTVTISFWVRSSMAGTFGGCLRNSAADYNYPFQYVINAANTWEQKSVTIAGATAGTWLTTNGVGAVLWFSIGAGPDYSDTVNVWTTKSGVISANSSTNLISSNGETFYITGVQLEAGSTATSFDYRPYGTELQLCQRYYFQTPNINTGSQIWDCTGLVTSTAGSIMMIPVPVTMRANPSVSINPSYNTGSFWNINIPSISNYPLTATPYLASYGGGACVPIVALTNTMPSSYIGLNCDFYCPTGTNTNNIILSAEL